MKSKEFWRHIVLIFKGIVVGFGAIMPGISGGTLCVVFGMYHILIDALSHPRKALKEHGWEIFAFLLGAAVGFFGLAGLAGWLMELNAQAVTCVFIGFILGTVPELWGTAGEKGRGKTSYFALASGFVLMLSILMTLRLGDAVTIAPSFWSFLFCGLIWGISFIVPGLSSSTLLLFFGLYQPMLTGIARFSLDVLIPLVFGMAVCLLVLPKAVKCMYQKWYAVISHAILGIVLASTASIIPQGIFAGAADLTIALVCICGGALISYFAGKACTRLEQSCT